MRLIAKRPCSFGGRNFYIGDEIPPELVTDPERQEKLGVISVSGAAAAEETPPEPVKQERMYTLEEVDAMISAAVETASAQTEQILAELYEADPGASAGAVLIAVRGSSDGGNEQITTVPALPEEIRQVFDIMQMSAEEGVRAVAGVESENVLILLHAAESRKMIKNAARERADRLFPAADDADTDDADTDDADADDAYNADTGAETEGAGT